MDEHDIRPIEHWAALGRAIRDARVNEGLSQHRLAERAGVSRSWLARVELGHRKAEIEYLMRIVNELGMTFALIPKTAPDIDPEFQQALRDAGLT